MSQFLYHCLLFVYIYVFVPQGAAKIYACEYKVASFSKSKVAFCNYDVRAS